MKKEEKVATRNTFMLYLMTFAKMVFPLLTLPYLTRVLSVDTYGVVTYVKAVMQYMQLLMAFGFSLSATKEIVDANLNKEKLCQILGDVQIAKMLLAVCAAVATVIASLAIPILRNNPLFVALSLLNAVITEMLAEYLFRGIDRMEVLTIRFVVSKLISTVCTFIFVKNDSHLLLIPIFDCLGSAAAFVMMLVDLKKMGIRMKPTGMKEVFRKLKESATYFASEMATTAFGALNTLMIGIYVDAAQVAYWGIVIQLVGAVNSLYTPITSGIYPSMIRTKSFKFIKKILMIFMPVVTVGCLICYFGAELIVTIVAGAEYIAAAPVFRAMLPVLFFSFAGMTFGWPTLGAIGKSKETSQTTVITAVAQVVGLVALVWLDQFTLIHVALLRGATELLMLVLRFGYCMKFRKEFND